MNVLPLGSYIMHLGMDWLYLHRTKVDSYDKVIEFLDDNGEKRILQGNKKPTIVRTVTTMHHKRSCRKGYVMFAFHISSEKGKDVEDVEILKVPCITTILGCVPIKYFRVSSSQGSGLFY